MVRHRKRSRFLCRHMPCHAEQSRTHQNGVSKAFHIMFALVGAKVGKFNEE
jgi:hypothetical protein